MIIFFSKVLLKSSLVHWTCSISEVEQIANVRRSRGSSDLSSDRNEVVSLETVSTVVVRRQKIVCLGGIRVA